VSTPRAVSRRYRDAVGVALCSLCVDDHRGTPGVLGVVVKLRGRLWWHGFHEPSARKLERFDPYTDDGVKPPPQARHEWLPLDDAPRAARMVPAASKSARVVQSCRLMSR
jgi:hypothetical protein